MGANYSQMFPGRPHFTEKNLPSLASKVFLITGGNSGIGLALVKILYSKNATVYVSGRSMEKIKAAIDETKDEFPLSTGQLKALLVDLADLDSTKTGAAQFLAQETSLDVLFLNAGVAQIPAGTITKHGHEIHMGTNCVGPFLLTQLLLPTLLKTAASEPTGSVRVVWTSSGIIDMDSIQGGLRLEELVPGHHGKSASQNYTSSKCGNWFLAAELDKRVRKSGVISVTQNPGTINTKGWNVFPWIKLLFKPIMYEPMFGAYTELWCGLSPDVMLEDGGRFAIPWGRWHPYPNKTCLESLKTKEEGGTGVAAAFWDWCVEQTKDYQIAAK